MSAPDAMSESLNYPAVKRRAVASRSYRVKIASSNGQTFQAGQTVNFDMQSNLAGTYCNWNQCYIKFKVVAAGNAARMDRVGAAGFISRVMCMTAGAQIFDLQNWNVLMTILMDTDSSPSYKGGVGNVLMGTNGGFQAGEELAAGGDGRTFCVPFVLHPFGMSTPHRLMPLFSSSPVQYRITLESIANSLMTSGTAPTALTFSEVELVCVFTELSPGAQAQVDQMSGGMYNVLASSYQNVGTTMGADSAVTANLGISVSSLERIIVCHRPTAQLNDIDYFSLGNRAKNGLTQYQIFINGESYPATPVIVENKGAEALSEFLLSDHSLVNFDKQSSFNVAVKTNASYAGNGTDGANAIVGVLEPYVMDTPTGTLFGSAGVDSNIGSFITAVELETGLSDQRSSRIYSGISTISSTINYRGTYSGAAAAQIDFFAQYTILLSLSTRGTNTWSVSV